MTKEFNFDHVIKGVGNNVECLTHQSNYTLSLCIVQDDVIKKCDIYLTVSDMSTTLILFSKSFSLHGGPPLPFTFDRLFLDQKLHKYKTIEERYNDTFNVTPEKIFKSTIYLGAYADEYDTSIPKEMVDQAYEIMMALYNNQSLKLIGEEKQCAEKISIDILL